MDPFSQKDKELLHRAYVRDAAVCPKTADAMRVSLQVGISRLPESACIRFAADAVAVLAP